jgi:hypothetical protein
MAAQIKKLMDAGRKKRILSPTFPHITLTARRNQIMAEKLEKNRLLELAGRVDNLRRYL